MSTGRHGVPPGGDGLLIIATTPNVIGKRRDPPDVGVGTRGEVAAQIADLRALFAPVP